MFVTLWVGVLDLTSGEVHYVSAGHNPPIVIRNSTPEYLRTKGGFVLAGLEGVIYKEHTFTLNKGDIVFLYTDGVTEANNANEELFGEERLLECIGNADEKTAAKLPEAVKKAVDAFVGGAPQFDDQTMLCFTFIGPDGADR